MPSLINSVVGWLRAGYPEGLPEHDYVPLFALLRRQLSPEEVAEVAAELTRRGEMPADNTDIGVLVTKVTNGLPLESDLARVRAHLAAGGWPLADPRN